MKNRTSRFALIYLVCLTLLATGTVTFAAAETPQPPSPEELTQRLQDRTAGAVTIVTDPDSGRVSFIGSDAEHPVRQAILWPSWTSPETAARQFLGTYGSLFGLQNQAEELTVKELETTDQGRSFVRFQQLHEGIPVLAGELIVHTDASRDVLSSNGEVVAGIALDTTPQVTAAAARDTALDIVAAEYDLTTAELKADTGELWIYNPSLLGAGPDFNYLVWRFDVTSVDLLPIRELVLVDAGRGQVALHFNQIGYAKDRRIYDNANNSAAGLPGIGPVRTEGGGSSGVADVNYAYDYTGHTYDFYFATHGRDSIDNAGLPLTSTVRYCDPLHSCPYANAFWNGTQMVFGQGYAAADDVVAHELTHGVTEYESGLLYYRQSGAINEAFSDIWGEFIDLTNGAGNDAPAVRWLCGEDLSIGAIRSLSNPPLYGLPDKMSSPNYWCSAGDYGGVHTNMGVGSKAAYLMVDGGAFNGKTVTGIGIPKTATIWYEVQTHLMTSGGDYEDLYYALQQACVNKIGTNGITSGDCAQVKNAIDAVEMDQQPAACAAPEAALCLPGQTSLDTFYDDFEDGWTGWSRGAASGPANWWLETAYAAGGEDHLWGDFDTTGGDHYIQSPSISIPAGASLHFDHAVEFRFQASNYWDGGVVEYSTGGPWLDAAPLFVANGPNGTISSTYSNPLGGRLGFVGSSSGYISSRVDLSSLAGQSVSFRWRVASSNNGSLATSNGDMIFGWVVDNVRIYTCGGTAFQVFLPLALKSYPEQPPTWVTIKNETFEGTFPGAWSLSSSGNYRWGRRSCRAAEGSYSAWAIGDNTSGDDPSCGVNYPINMESWMVYGPFSLADAQAGELTFDIWINTESGYDALCAMISLNGTNFSGWCYDGNSGGWIDRDYDLTNFGTLGDLTGQPQVWMAFIFDSDTSNTYAEGAHVDNVVLRKCIAGNCDASGSSGDVPGVQGRATTLTRPE